MSTTVTRHVVMYMYAPKAKTGGHLFNLEDMEINRHLGRLIFLVKDSVEFRKWDFRIYRFYSNGAIEIVSDRLIDKIASNRTLSMRYLKEQKAIVEPYEFSKESAIKAALDNRERKLDTEKRETFRRF